MRDMVTAGVIVGVCVMAIGACGGTTARSADDAAANSAPADLHGAGSTFAYPLYSAWAQAYGKQSGVSITYASIGSGDGIRRFSDETIDFGGTDGPMSDSELANAKGGAVLHIPTAMGADVVTYNLPGVTAPLRF
ncbi:MAG TPA: substrate-binding domain-containing protein, partial [Gemmatimonadaceae bacterium]|nr:substrate-binding domain-containing protein [Gemmatimonadaceae bacterium]